MLYNKNGMPLVSAYSKNGDILSSAYSKDGTQVYPDGPILLKIMQYNVGGWYYGAGSNVPSAKFTEYYNLHRNTILECNPDILVINEYWADFSDSGYSAYSFLLEFFPYVYAYPYSSRKSMGRAFCSKYPLSNYQSHLFADYSPRYYDSMTAKINGVDITIVLTHSGLTQAERTAEIAELISYLQTINTPLIVGGDFNTGITPASANVESTAYINNVKPFLDAGFKTANFGDFGFLLTCVDNTNETHYYLDNFYLSPGFSISNVYVDDRKMHDLIDDPIDHMPIVAVVSLN